jgi:3-oxoacyl-[acyl-carrier protein] reductase
MPHPVALVTGASRGIGRGIALALADLHWNIVVNFARNAAAAAETVAEIENRGGRAVAVQADISLAADRARLVEQALKHFSRIDLLVNNAGVAPDSRADILEATEESFDRVLAINLKGPYFLTQLVANEMIKTRQLETGNRKLETSSHPPAIVTISSVSAYAASTHRGDYCIAKAGLGMLTKLFAARLAEFGINVYEIRPGIIATDMTGPVQAKYDALLAAGLTPINRWGTPDDVARAVSAIAQNLLPFSTGEVLNVDGGFHFHRL